MLPAAAREGRIDGSGPEPAGIALDAVPGCGMESCALDRGRPVRDAGMDFIECPDCRVLRIPPANLIHSNVLPDPRGNLSLVMRILMSLRMFWLRSAFPSLRDKHVAIADIGCGDGQFLEFLKSKGYDRVFGIEPDEVRARNAQLRSVPVFSTRAEAEASGLFRSAVDIMFVWHVLEHVDRPADFLRQYVPWLAEAGSLIISVPNQASIQTRLFGYLSAYPDYGRHIWYHKPDYLEWFTRNVPDVSAELLPDRNYEYEVFAWVDSIASAMTRQQNFIHKAVKKGEGSMARRAAAIAMAIVLLPIAVVLAPFSIVSGNGSTLTFVLRRS